ncbi:MAG: hypothetical protein IKE15_04100 [Clostridia bacterium]|nr:hypothetical protein [Clostridia bacterium]
MLLRPADASGDILPALSSGALLRGAPAVARLVKYRLELLAGEWWENPEWGNAAVDMLRESRFTEADRQALASYIATYIRETPGVLDVDDVTFSVENGRQFAYQCTVVTNDGYAEIDFSL